MKKFLIAATAISLVLITHTNALADGPVTDEELLKAMQKQIDALQKQVNNLQTKLDKQEKEKSKQVAGAAGNVSSGDDIKISMKPSPKIETADGRFSFQTLGRIQMEYAFFDDDLADHPNGANFRRSRLGFMGSVEKDWQYKMEIDFAKEAVNFKDAYLAYTGIENTEFKVGNFKPPYSLEELTSDNYGTFVERASPTLAFATGGILGAGVTYSGSNWSASTGIFNEDAGTASADDEAWSVGGRLTYAPIMDKENERVVHLGVSETYRTPSRSADTFVFSAAAENGQATLKSVNATVPATADSALLTGLEAAWVEGPVSIQGEYNYINVDRQSATDPSFSGLYAQASYFITGESRQYNSKNGTFNRLKPKNNFSIKDGTWGAWEVAARYSNIDLNDAGITGGEMNNVTAGVNWYINPNVRIMFNTVFVNTDPTGPAGVANDDPMAYLLRFQVDF